MEISFTTLFLLPIGLGLLGFIEPCTIGAHMIFLNTQNQRSAAEKRAAIRVFILVRSLAAGIFGALASSIGIFLISVQTNLWLVFGMLYLSMGILFIIGRSGLIKKPIKLAPDTWKKASSPIMLGIVFGLNIPACAAPIIFGLLSLASTADSVMTGFVMMFLFGLALSLPLLAISGSINLNRKLSRLGQYLKEKSWILGVIFIVLGIWSIWFGFNVNPAEWA